MKHIIFSQDQIGTLLGSGGEADVYRLVHNQKYAAKIFRKIEHTPAKKLEYMIANPPNPSSIPGHIDLSWPLGTFTKNGRVSGYYMPIIEGGQAIFNVYNPKARKNTFPDFTWFHLHHIAINLARIVAGIHERGYVIGDLNESNILVLPNALVSLIDTDSFQITIAGTVHHCRVGKPELLAPELQGSNLSTTTRTIHQDLFGLGILLFQLLMNGSHPFRGRGGPDTLCDRIKDGLFPFGPKAKGTPPPGVFYDDMDADVRNMFQRCFTDGNENPQNRPSAEEWLNVLTKAKNNLKTCKKNSDHQYIGKNCPHCQRHVAPKPTRFTQSPLPVASTTQVTQVMRKPLAQTRQWQSIKPANFLSTTNDEYQLSHDFAALIGFVISAMVIGSGYEFIQNWFYAQSWPFFFWGLCGAGTVGLLAWIQDQTDEVLTVPLGWFMSFYLLRFVYFIFAKITSGNGAAAFITHYCYVLAPLFLITLYPFLRWLARKKYWMATLTSSFYILGLGVILFFHGPKVPISPSPTHEPDLTVQSSSEAPSPQTSGETLTPRRKKPRQPASLAQASNPRDLSEKWPNDFSETATESKPSTDTQNARGNDAEQKLWEVLKQGNMETATVLIENGGLDYAYRDANGVSLLAMIVKNADTSMLLHLKKHTGYLDPDIQNANGDTLLMIAVRQGDSEKVRTLLKEFVPNAALRNDAGETAFQIAEQERDKFKKRQFRKRRPFKRILKLLKKYNQGERIP